MKKLLSLLILAALVASLACVALAGNYDPDEADKDKSVAGWYTVKATVPDGITYTYLYNKPSSTKGDNLAKLDNGTKVYVYYKTPGIGKKSSTWAYVSANGREGFVRWPNLTSGNYSDPTPAPTPEATATPKPTEKPTPKPTAKPTVKPTVKPTATPTLKPTVKPTPRPTPKPSDSPELVKMTVVKCNFWVSLREEPDTRSTRLKQVPKGAEVIGYKFDDTWAACYYDDEFGYILLEYLEEKK